MRRTDVPSTIEWQCIACGNEGVINGWEGSPFDLQAVDPQPAADRTLLVAAEVAEALRTVMLLDSACERIVFGARIVDGSVLIEATDEDLDTLIESVAAEANHEPNRRRQRRLDAAYEAITRDD